MKNVGLVIYNEYPQVFGPFGATAARRGVGVAGSGQGT